MKAFGRALTGFRLQAGFKTQESAAEAVGIERSRLVKHENGTGGVPQASTLQRYEAGYGLPAGSLMRVLDGEPTMGRNVAESGSSGAPTATVREPVHVPYSVQGAEDAPTFPPAVRLRENQIERELIEAGATEQQIRDFRRSVRESPLIAAMFRGGAPGRVVSEAEMQLYEGVAIGFRAIVEQMIADEREAARRR